MGYRLGLTFLSEVEENPDLVSLKLQKGGPMALIANDKVLAVMLSEKEYQALLEKENPQMDPGRGVRKVGNFVRSRMEGLISSGRLPENEVQRLCDRAYCKAVFRMGYPVLREIPDSCAQDFQSLRACCCNTKGRLYYYTKAYRICGKSYVLCNRWREHPHRKTFQKWLQKFYEN